MNKKIGIDSSSKKIYGKQTPDVMLNIPVIREMHV